MKKIERLRQMLYEAIDRNDNEEIIKLSERLDLEILKFTRNRLDVKKDSGDKDEPGSL